MKKLYFILTLLLMLVSGLQSIQATTVYYNNPNKWASVYCYVYNSETENNATWPGAAMTYDATATHNGKTGWWKVSVPAGFEKAKYFLNNGTPATSISGTTQYYTGKVVNE